MKSTFRSAMHLCLLSALTCLSVAACVDPGDGDDRESTQDPDESNLGVATEPLLSSTKRISYWPGKVNTHIGSGGTFVKDNDCTSGSGINQLTYCQKFYPATMSFTEVALSPKPALVWNSGGCGQQYSGTGTREWTCTEPPRVSYWPGKVNVHRDPGGAWVSDNDCSTGSGIDALTYCKKYYPTTTSVTNVALSTKPALLWNSWGCGQQYSGNGTDEWTCNDSPRISYFPGKVNVHRDPGGTWVKDDDCSSGSDIDALTYCKKLYPATTSVTAVSLTPKPALVWNSAGCGAQYSSIGTYEWTCNQP